MTILPWQSKPGVDWSKVEAGVRAGKTFAELSRDLSNEGIKISAWAINKRARKHGWVEPKFPKTAPATDWLQATERTTTSRAIAAPQDASETRIARAGVRTPERMAEILGLIQIGASRSAAAAAAGTNHNTFANWIEDDPEFAQLVSQAEGKMVVRNLERIDRAAEQDWRAADKLLSSIPAAREHWTPNTGGPQGAGGVTVVINVRRAHDVAADTVDVTPSDRPIPQGDGHKGAGVGEEG